MTRSQFLDAYFITKKNMEHLKNWQRWEINEQILKKNTIWTVEKSNFQLKKLKETLEYQTAHFILKKNNNVIHLNLEFIKALEQVMI